MPSHLQSKVFRNTIRSVAVGVVLHSAVGRISVVAHPGQPLAPRALRFAGRLVFAASGLMIAGCGNAYRPVVSAINPVGPATQPTKYAVVVSNPGLGLPGQITILDVSGDSVIVNAQVGPNPSYFALGLTSDGYVLHCKHDPVTTAVNGPCDSTIDAFSVSPSLMTNAIRQTSLVAGAQPFSATGVTGNVFFTQPGLSNVAAANYGQPPAVKQQLITPANPTYTFGSNRYVLTTANGSQASSSRVYTLSAGAAPGTSLGTATGIDLGTNINVSSTIPVGINPVHGIMNADNRRAFVVNRSSNSVTVINTQTNSLDISSNLPAGTIAVGSTPVWADVATGINELAVVNQGNGSSAGSLTIINIPLCSAITQPGTGGCDTTNPIDAVGFGNVLGTVAVGVKPVMVSILQDQNKAYVANADGTVSVISLTTPTTLIKTIPVGGTLNWIATTSGSPTGKVYVTAEDTQVLTIINTDTDVVTATVPLQGNGIAVQVTEP